MLLDMDNERHMSLNYAYSLMYGRIASSDKSVLCPSDAGIHPSDGGYHKIECNLGPCIASRPV